MPIQKPWVAFPSRAVTTAYGLVSVCAWCPFGAFLPGGGRGHTLKDVTMMHASRATMKEMTARVTMMESSWREGFHPRAAASGAGAASLARAAGGPLSGLLPSPDMLCRLSRPTRTARRCQARLGTAEDEEEGERRTREEGGRECGSGRICYGTRSLSSLDRRSLGSQRGIQ